MLLVVGLQQTYKRFTKDKVTELSREVTSSDRCLHN